MSSKKIVHIGFSSVFIPKFYDYCEKHFSQYNHMYLLKQDFQNQYPIDGPNVFIGKPGKLNRIHYYLRVWFSLLFGHQIILHGLSDPMVLKLMSLTPWNLHKCHWFLWGGDLYAHVLGSKDRAWHRREKLCQQTIPRLASVVTFIRAEYELARKWYGAQGEYLECFRYPCNLYKAPPTHNPNPSQPPLIQVGNSADPGNLHLEVLEKLKAMDTHEYQILCPLTYGDMDYASQVIRYGNEAFGDAFQPLQSNLPYEEYMQLLAGVQIAAFNHQRQQALGNILQLLNMGKKVYLRKDALHYQFLIDIGVHVFDISNLELAPLEPKKARENQAVLQEYFSEQNYQAQLHRIFSWKGK